MISDKVKELLKKAVDEEVLKQIVEQWADDTLPGRPAILGACMYSSLEKAIEQTMIEQDNKIEERFPVRRED